MKNIRTDESGIALVITALAMVAVVGMVALVVDSGFMEHRKLTLQTAADAAALRASQLYYDGSTDDQQIDQAAREVAKANLLLANFRPEQADSSAAEMTIGTDTENGVIQTTIGSAQHLYFANGINAQDHSALVVSPTSASYVRKDLGKQHYRHLYVIVSVFASMGADFRDGKSVTYTDANGHSAIAATKSAAAVAGVQQVLETLDGEQVTLIGYGDSNEQILQELPVDDHPSLIDPRLTNRQFAVRKTAGLLRNELGARLLDALKSAKAAIENLAVDEREYALVLVVSDGVGFGSQTGFLNPEAEGECWAEAGASMQTANEIRDLGGKISTMGIFAFGAGMSQAEYGGQVTPDDIWEQIGMLGRMFLKSLAAAHRYPIICGIETTVFPNNVKPGQYFEPVTEREVAVFFDEVTSRAEFTGKLPRRVNS